MYNEENSKWTDNIGRDKNKLQENNEYTSDIHYGSKPDKFLPSST